MQIELDSRPSYGIAVVRLDKGESIVAEAGTMVAMSGDLLAEPGLSGAKSGDIVSQLKALLFALARKYLAGESVFVNHFKAKSDGQQVLLAPMWIGDVIHIPMDGSKKIIVQAGSYLASTPKVTAELVWGGFSMLFGGEGAFFLGCKGTGDLIINAYGAIEKVELDGKYVVDTGHVVAWEGDLKYHLRRAGGWKASLMSGEGMVLEFNGKGTLYLQTRNPGAFVSWISPFFR